jgi:hypothetical protein
MGSATISSTRVLHERLGANAGEAARPGDADRRRRGGEEEETVAMSARRYVAAVGVGAVMGCEGNVVGVGAEVS